MDINDLQLEMNNNLGDDEGDYQDLDLETALEIQDDEDIDVQVGDSTDDEAEIQFADGEESEVSDEEAVEVASDSSDSSSSDDEAVEVESSDSSSSDDEDVEVESSDSSSSSDDEDLQLNEPEEYGEIGAYMDASEAHGGYTRSIPKRFTEEKDDRLMNSMIKNYAREVVQDGSLTGHMFLNKVDAKAASDEVRGTHEKHNGEGTGDTFEDVWNHFDVNKDGLVEVERMP